LAAIPPLLFLSVFFLWPVGAILLRGLRPGEHWNLSVFGDVLSDRTLQKVLWFTLWESVASTVLCVLVALPGASMFARYRFRGKRVLWSALLVPFVLPTVVVAVSMLGVIGSGGLAGVNLTGSVWAILIAHVFFNYAVVVRVVGELWRHLDPHEEDAARMLGASRWRVWWEVTFPALRPGIVAAATITFLFCFTSFGVILFLGGPTRSTIETEIYRQTTRFLDLPLAAALSIVQLSTVVALLWLVGRFERAAVPRRLRAAREIEHRARTLGDRLLLVGNLAVMAVLLALPLGVLVVRSLTPPSGFGLASYRALSELRRGSTLYVAPLDAIGNSLPVRPRGDRIGRRLVSKIDGCFDVGQEIEKGFTDRGHGPPYPASHAIEGSGQLGRRAGIRDPYDGFGLHKIDPSTQERPQRELAATGFTASEPARLRKHIGNERSTCRQLQLGKRPTDRPAWARPKKHVNWQRSPCTAQAIRCQVPEDNPRLRSERRESWWIRIDEPDQNSFEAIPCQPHDRTSPTPPTGCSRRNEIGRGKHRAAAESLPLPLACESALACRIGGSRRLFRHRL